MSHHPSRPGFSGERLAGICGLLAFVAFNAGWIAADLAQRQAFSPTRDDISDLGALTATSPWLYNHVATNLSGLLVVALGIGVWRALSPSRLGRVGAAALIAMGGDKCDIRRPGERPRPRPACDRRSFGIRAPAHTARPPPVLYLHLHASNALLEHLGSTRSQSRVRSQTHTLPPEPGALANPASRCAACRGAQADCRATRTDPCCA